MAAVIVTTNQKGGVGKTTTACALLAGLRQRGAKVLGVDLDPQGSLGFCLGLDIENCATIYDVMKGNRPIREVIVQSESGDILPSNILLSAAELEFNRPGREFLLKNCLAEVAEEYDYIIIDTPPALNVLTVNAYVAADGLIIPMAPEILSLLGVAQIRETIDTVRRCYNSRLRVLGILLNKYNQRFTLNREVLDMAEQIAKQPSWIPRCSRPASAPAWLWQRPPPTGRACSPTPPTPRWPGISACCSTRSPGSTAAFPPSPPADALPGAAGTIDRTPPAAASSWMRDRGGDARKECISYGFWQKERQRQ